jgi:hypothetical protein
MAAITVSDFRNKVYPLVPYIQLCSVVMTAVGLSHAMTQVVATFSVRLVREIRENVPNTQACLLTSVQNACTLSKLPACVRITLPALVSMVVYDM